MFFKLQHYRPVVLNGAALPQGYFGPSRGCRFEGGVGGGGEAVSF